MMTASRGMLRTLATALLVSASLAESFEDAMTTLGASTAWVPAPLKD